ncbi:nucleoredoxin-like protein 2 isoform X1 [Lampetra fluviatilis]
MFENPSGGPRWLLVQPPHCRRCCEHAPGRCCLDEISKATGLRGSLVASALCLFLSATPTPEVSKLTSGGGRGRLPPALGRGLSRRGRAATRCRGPLPAPRRDAGVVVLLLLLLLVLLVLLCWLCRQRLGYATLPSSLTAQQMLREWVQLHHVLRHSPEHAESEAQGHAEPAASAAGGDRDTDPSPTYTISFQPAPPPPPPPPANFPWRRGERASVGIGP